MATDVELSGDVDWLHRLARRLARDESDAQDLVQDVLVEATTNMPADLRSRRGWLAGVLRRRNLMVRRAEGRRRVREARAADGDHAVAARSADAELHDRHLADALADALATLEPTDQRLLVERYVHERDSHELGRMFDMPSSTVRSRLARSRAHLRRELGQRLGPDRRWSVVAAAPTAVGASGGAAAPSSSALGVLLVTTAGKILVALAGVALVFMGWRVLAPNDGGPRAAEPVPALQPDDEDDPVRSPKVADRDLAEARAARLATIKAARRHRLAEMVPEEPDDDALQASFREEIEDMFGDEPGDFGRVFTPLVEQLGSGLLECVKDVSQDATGKMNYRLSLIGEPGVGAIVEHVEVHTEGDPDPAIVECGEQSVYTADLPDPEDSMLETITISIDLDTRDLSIGATLPADELGELLDRYPDLLANPDVVAKLVEETPELADVFRDLKARDPSWAERFPALDAAITDER